MEETNDHPEQPQTEKGYSTSQVTTSHRVFTEWTQGTSIHGVPYATSEDFFLWKRLIWIIIVTGWAGTLLWQISELIEDYRAYHTTMTVESRVQSGLSFPEITLCPANPVSKSRLESSGVAVDEDGYLLPESPEEIDLISFPAEDVIFSTEFNWETVETSEWKPVISQDQRCFRFSNREKRVHQSGLQGGLQVTVFMNSHDARQSGPFTGVTVYVSAPGTTETKQQPFLLALPGAFHTINLSRELIERETRSPWTKCVQDANYTQLKCQEECMEKQHVGICGCRRLTDDKNTNLPFCTATTNAECDFDSQVDEELCNTRCARPSCQQTVYTTTSSFSRFNKEFLNISDSIIDEFLVLHINYDAMRESVVSETPSMTFSQLLGNIGGQMGLFLGISVISLMEVGELVLVRLIPRMFGERRLYGIGGRS